MKLKLKDVVRLVLQEHPETRTNDKKLYWWVMNKYTKIFIPFDDFDRVPHPDSIGRTKRKIMERNELHEVIDPEPGVTYLPPLPSWKKTNTNIKNA